MGPAQFRLLKLLSTRTFQRSFYRNLEQIAKGAYGVVYACKLGRGDMKVRLRGGRRPPV